MKPDKKFKTLYICYFGVLEPLVQTQVLPYLREIQKGEVAVSLLTFEPNPKKNWTKEKIETEKKKLADEGIEWNFLTYHKRPSAPATLFDVMCGAFFIWKKIRRDNLHILHARVQVPAMMCAIAKKFSFGKKPKLLFDIRGFFPEEYTDAGIWKENGWLYKSVKRIEKWIFKKSDGFVVLTEKAREILFPESKETGVDKFGRPVEVIPCCVDFKRFASANKESRGKMRKKLNIENRKVIVYVGSFGGWYLTDEMLDFFAAAREQDVNTFVLILTQREKEKVVEKLKAKNFSDQDFLVESVLPEEISVYLSAADIALSFIKACYSKQASSPTKIAEYLACGLPVISNSGVGDLDALIEGQKTGLILEGFSQDIYVKALELLDEKLKDKSLGEHCQKSAYREFDLEEVGGVRYRRVYQSLLQN